MLRQHARGRRRLVSAWAVLLLAALAGCSGGPRWAKVHGRVTVNDKPVTAGRITFMHEDGRSTLAEIKPDGSYSLDKAPVGTLKVGIESMDFSFFAARMPKRTGGGKMQDPNNPNPAPPDPSTVKSGASVSRIYNDPKSSGLKAEVKDGEDNKIDFPLKGI